ncbi:MAG: hypothetical protein ABII82_04605 [Verrucomicrobiota bacterium]
MATTDNVLVSLSGLTLPSDLPWRVNFVQMVDGYLEKLHAEHSFRPPRFFGYYFKGGDAIAMTGCWTVMLDACEELDALRESVEEMSLGQFSIAGPEDNEPDFMLIHDRYDGSCWLWRFGYGQNFVSATEAMQGGVPDED